ncbi:Transposase [Cordylochernes scorpioides]|uniref:Transposase n=1 Tax=Cordylochernes scorpioides TaxID=51811 RepID=A0ABY6LHY5_9ARAC|nr:Transposase [Cordylochernes scorpioides]
MNPNDNIATHISKVETLAQQMKDLAWDSVSSEEKTLENLTARLLKEESLQDHWDSSGNFKPDNALMTFSKFNRNSTASNKQQQHQQSIKDKKKNTHCGYCKKKGHWWKECYKRKEEQKGQQPSSSARDDSCAFSAETSAFLAETKDSWIADSGATDHMTSRREWFSTFEEIPEGVHPVYLGDGKKIYAKEMCPKDDQEIEEMNKIPNRQTIGSLMYLMTGTRPDIAYAVSRRTGFVLPNHWSTQLNKETEDGITDGRTTLLEEIAPTWPRGGDLSRRSMEMSTPANSTNLAILGLHPSAYKVRRTPVIKAKWDVDGARGSERMWGQQTHGSWRMPDHRKRRQFEQTDAFTRGMVIGLKRAGWSIRQIAADTHLGASTVHRLWRRWLEQGNVAIYRNIGATRVTSARVDRRILRQEVAAPQATCTAILQHVQDTLDHSISTRTISRRLVANGLHSCRPLRRLPLSPPNRRQRLEWCRARSTLITEWHRVVFSNESRFCLSSDSRRVRVWRRRGERSNPAAIVERPTVRQRGIMVWGAIAYDSRSPLLRIQGTMTVQRYVDDVLRPVTLPYLQGVPKALYQQDNARPHTARNSQQALQDVQMLPWPPYSPDFSPIEHVWDIIGRRWHALPQPRSEDELWQMVEREWRAIPQDAIRTLIDSLPRRVAACIAVRGGPTCY